MPERAGTLNLPPVRVHWFDTDSGTERLARLPGRQLTVLPALAGQGEDQRDSQGDASEEGAGDAAGRRAGSGEPADATVDDALASSALSADSASRADTPLPAEAETTVATHPGWQRWAIGLPLMLALALSALVLLWRLPRRRGPPARVAPPNAAVRRRLAASCRQGDDEAMTAAVMAWAQDVWPLDTPRSLAGVSERLPTGDDGSVMQACRRTLTELDAARYSSRTSMSQATNQETLAARQLLPAQLDEAWRQMRRHAVADAGDVRHLPAL